MISVASEERVWQIPPMGIKREELLYTLLWAGEVIMQPTFRNLTESFEGWAYRNGLLRQLQRLEKEQLLERSPGYPGDRLRRLTERGRLCALGGRDPEASWNRPWDGLWRLALFDVPEAHDAVRDKLRAYLRGCGFGCLQNSVWITPDPVRDQRTLLAGSKVDVGSLIFLQARPCTGESDAEIVLSAWDFTTINLRYQRYREVLASRPQIRSDGGMETLAMHGWLHAECESWFNAVKLDPLLPACLLPPGYAGREAWHERRVAMVQIGEQMRSFRGQQAPRQFFTRPR
jgi:phenylacetic acid degradation operon negative regulatory protein